ncbi:MAG: hypothetical protein R2828_19130 [Saprospiraceae bacterium]
MESNTYFWELDHQSLIQLIEDPDPEKTQYKTGAQEELDSRNISPEEIMALAIAVNEDIAYEKIVNEDITKAEVSMHKSTFLSEDEIKQIYIQQLEKYIKYKNQFRFDVWSYAIGGI